MTATPEKPQDTISAPGLSSDTELLKMALGNTAACLGDVLAIFNRVAGYAAFKNSDPASAIEASEGYPGIAHDFETMRDALVRIAKSVPTPEDSIHGPRMRCQHCGHAWVIGRDAEHHGDNCAYVIAAKAIRAP